MYRIAAFVKEDNGGILLALLKQCPACDTLAGSRHLLSLTFSFKVMMEDIANKE